MFFHQAVFIQLIEVIRAQEDGESVKWAGSLAIPFISFLLWLQAQESIIVLTEYLSSKHTTNTNKFMKKRDPTWNVKQLK